MKVLITGVAGLLGSRLSDWILKNKPEIEITDKFEVYKQILN